MVSIFFVISGYVLSDRVVHLRHQFLRAGSRQGGIASGESLAAVLASSIVRRGVRLFQPALITSATILVLVHLGLYDNDRLARLFPKFHPPRAARLPGTAAQLKDWSSWVVHELTNPWDWESLKSPAAATYASHLWTIPAEFRCSMVLFALLLPLSQMRPGLRAGMIWASLLAYCALWERWDMALFLAGLGLAVGDGEENRLKHPRDSECGGGYIMSTLPRMSSTTMPHLGFRSIWSEFAALLPILTLLAGAWLASFPDEHGHEAAGFVLLGFISRSRHLWHAAGAILIVWSVRRVEAIKVLLLHPLFRYLGCISFSLYMVHEPILQVWGWWWTGWLKSTCVDVAPWAPESMVILAAFCTVTTFVILVADYAWTLVDKPAVRSSKCLERYLFDPK
ncbi:hypothetical protein DHEL01_v212967 [Diaporthe helianthi]|uniref:Acyltransferase 3 domain-containing protein n=1 Tax=Diaporthe helianthi TaxID=158607 RepID=A0A2P5HEG5_DIAHE|nr:hypothetical protein DHEL01_v212967 [Diaporthe helianthi]